MRKSERAFRKLVIVGDGGCGKTCLLTVFCKGVFPKIYVPTVFESYVQHVQVDNISVELALWDTAGQEEYDRLRIHSYPNTDIVLVCFALDNIVSLHNIENKWHHEVYRYCYNVPVILVGCKKDLKSPQSGSDTTKNLVQTNTLATVKKIKKMRKMLEAVAYLECSALTGEGVQKVFEVAASYALQHKESFKRREQYRCIIL